jgi:hypothetical protein
MPAEYEEYEEYEGSGLNRVQSPNYSLSVSKEMQIVKVLRPDPFLLSN